METPVERHGRHPKGPLKVCASLSTNLRSFQVPVETFPPDWLPVPVSRTACCQAGTEQEFAKRLRATVRKRAHRGAPALNPERSPCPG